MQPVQIGIRSKADLDWISRSCVYNLNMIREIFSFRRDSRLRRWIGLIAVLLAFVLVAAPAWCNDKQTAEALQRCSIPCYLTGIALLWLSIVPLVLLRMRSRRAYGAMAFPTVTHAQATRWIACAVCAAPLPVLWALALQPNIPTGASAVIWGGIIGTAAALLGGSLIWACIAAMWAFLAIVLNAPCLHWLLVIPVFTAWMKSCSNCGDWLGRRVIDQRYLGSSTSTSTQTVHENCPVTLDVPHVQHRGGLTSYGTTEVSGSMRVARDRVTTRTHHHYWTAHKCRSCGYRSESVS